MNCGVSNGRRIGPNRYHSTMYAELASSTHTRQRWEEDGAWQPLREAVENMLIAYDWGEAFVALNLAVKLGRR